MRRSTSARLPGRLLGAHVSQRAGQVAGQRQPGVALHVGHAEVGDPEVAAAIEQQVGRLDVAVDDPLVVGVAECLGGLDAQPGDGAHDRRGCESTGWPFGGLCRTRCRRRWRRSLGVASPRRRREPARQACPGARALGLSPERAIVGGHGAAVDEPAQLGDQVGQAAPLDKLHRVVGDVGDDAHGIDRHDLRVLQAGRRPGPRAGTAGWPGDRAAAASGRTFERNPPADRDLAGLVDDPHPAPADLADDAEVTEDLALCGVRPVGTVGGPVAGMVEHATSPRKMGSSVRNASSQPG